MVGWMENDELFRKELAEGQKYERIVAGWLAEEGISVKVPPQKCRPHVRERHHYGGGKQCDIILVDLDEVLEVKSRNEEFTCVEDFPYPTIFVDTVWAWERKPKKPLAVVVVSQLTERGRFVIPRFTSERWVKVAKHDTVRDTDRIWWSAPRDCCVTWERLIARLKGERTP
jgi:hypothetical protein